MTRGKVMKTNPLGSDSSQPLSEYRGYCGASEATELGSSYLHDPPAWCDSTKESEDQEFEGRHPE